MRLPDKRIGPEPGKDQAGAESSEAGNLRKDHSSIVVALPPVGWKTAMRRAHAIRKYRGTAKVYAVKLWRVAVVDALGQEGRR